MAWLSLACEGGAATAHGKNTKQQQQQQQKEEEEKEEKPEKAAGGRALGGLSPSVSGESGFQLTWHGMAWHAWWRAALNRVLLVAAVAG